MKLGDVCKVFNGGTPDTKVKSYWYGENAWVGPAEMGKLVTPFLGETRRYLTDAGLSNSSAQMLPINSVIMSSRAPIGHLIINTVPMATNQGCKGLVPNRDVNFKFLYYFLFANKEYLNSLGSGTTFAEISGTTLKSVEMPLPPLPEQKAIVEKLDAAFAEIDKLEANLASIEKLSKDLLKSANRKFFDDSHDHVMRLCEIADFEGGQQPPKSEFVFEKKSGYVRFVQIRDFKSDRNVTYIPNSSRNRICKESDVLIGRYGASVGQILTGLAGAYNVALMKVLPKEEIVSRSYLFHYLQSESFQSLLANVAQRSAQAGFSKDDIANFPVPVPDLQEQDSIANHLEEISTSIEKLQLGIRQKRELAKSLIKSMLNFEFTGAEDVV